VDRRDAAPIPVRERDRVDDIIVPEDEPLHFSTLPIGQASTIGLPIVATSAIGGAFR
jgi:hypothetical protein